MKKSVQFLGWMIVFCLGYVFHVQAENSFFSLYDTYFQERCCESPIYVHPARIYAGGIVGQGLGCENKRYATLGVFYAPFFNSCLKFQPFVDIRGHYLRNDKWAANVGGGVRYQDPCTARVWGVNLFYDYRNECLGTFNQIGVGVESLGVLWDLRANGYFPLNKERKRSQLFDHYIGDFFAICKRSEFGLTGADFEAGVHFFKFCQFDLYAGAGGYYYHRCRCCNIWGGMARLKALYTEYLSLDVVATFDRVYHTNVQGILTFSIPFEVFTGACGLASDFCQSLLLQPVERNNTITVDKRCCWRSNF